MAAGVSVVIAVYNGERFIERAVRSALEQTYADLEVIIVDDGSTDSTIEVISSRIDDRRIRLHRQENRGQAAAKNAGANLATRDFIAFLDADDTWEPDKLAAQMTHFDDSAVGVVYSNRLYVDEDDRPIDPQPGFVERPSGIITEQLFVQNFIPFASTVVRREVFHEEQGFDESLSMGIDWDLWLRISVRWKFRYIDRKLLNYRVWGGQMSKNVAGRYDGAFRIMDKFLAAHGDSVSERVRRTAYADTYARRGLSRATLMQDGIGGFRDCIKALGYRLTYAYAWKALLKIPLRRLRGAVSAS